MVTTNNSAAFEGAYFSHVVHVLDMHFSTSETGISAKTRLTGMVLASIAEHRTNRRKLANGLNVTTYTAAGVTAVVASSTRHENSSICRPGLIPQPQIGYEPRRKLLR